MASYVTCHICHNSYVTISGDGDDINNDSDENYEVGIKGSVEQAGDGTKLGP